MPFKVGTKVIERIGIAPDHTDRDVTITDRSASGDVKTSTGHWYTGFGSRIPSSDSYRSLRSVGYRHEPEETAHA